MAINQVARTADVVAEDGKLLGDVGEIIERRFKFRPELPISTNSCYGDSVWDWNNPSNPRLKTCSPSQLKIDWELIRSKRDIPERIVIDLKKYALMRYAYSPHVFQGTRRGAHPRTLTGEVMCLVNFISYMRSQKSGDGYCLINSLSDIETQDLDDALSTYKAGNQDGLKRGLKCLCSPVLGQLLDFGPVKWNAADVDNLESGTAKKHHYQRLPDGMFRYLSTAATADVKQFLQALGIETQDKEEMGEGPNLFLREIENFRQLFDEYAEYASYRKRSTEKGSEEGHRFRALEGSLKNRKGLLLDLIDRARMAAQTIITQYTGCRYSELALLPLDCLQQEGERWFIIGTVIKREPINAPIEQDKWIAISIVRDAVRVLQETARLTKTEFLFHGQKIFIAGRPMAAGGLAGRLTAYLALVDTEGRWRGCHLHSHMVRHSLAFELRKIGLGIPAISLQLKHLFYDLGQKINNTTLGYGGISKDVCTLAIEEANSEALREVFHPDAPVAGGGAEQFKQRRAAYFQGMALAGFDANQVLRQLAKEGGLPLTDVGTAYCQGQKKVMIDGVREDPPCIGGLRCNPVRCAQGIIPKHKLPVWRKIRDENRRRAQEPEFAYARPYLKRLTLECG